MLLAFSEAVPKYCVPARTGVAVTPTRGQQKGSVPAMRESESVLRKSLHHPLIYVLVLIVVTISSLVNGQDLASAFGAGIGGAIVVWVLTYFLP